MKYDTMQKQRNEITSFKLPSCSLFQLCKKAVMSWSSGACSHAVRNMQHQGFMLITKDIHNAGSNGNEIWSRWSVKSQYMSVKISKQHGIVFMKALFRLCVALLRASSTGPNKNLCRAKRFLNKMWTTIGSLSRCMAVVLLQYALKVRFAIL